MELREAKLKMIDAVPGGWATAAGFLGLTENALRNRVYEVKDQKLPDEKSLMLQELSKTSYYADAIARASGGVFVRLPDAECENEDLMRKFNELYVLMGNFSRNFDTALSNDNVIDKQEEEILQRDVHLLQKSASELLALMIRVYGINNVEADHGGR